MNYNRREIPNPELIKIPIPNGYYVGRDTYNNGYMSGYAPITDFKSTDFFKYRIYNHKYRSLSDSDQGPYESTSIILYNEKIYILEYASYPSCDSHFNYNEDSSTTIGEIIELDDEYCKVKWHGSVDDFYTICKNSIDYNMTNRELDNKDYDYEYKRNMYDWYINWFESYLL